VLRDKERKRVAEEKRHQEERTAVARISKQMRHLESIEKDYRGVFVNEVR